MVCTMGVVDGDRRITSTSHKLERSRASFYVEVDLAPTPRNPEPHGAICAVSKFLMLQAPAALGAADPHVLRVVVCDVFDAMPPLRDPNLGDVLRAKVAPGDGQWKHENYVFDMCSIKNQLVVLPRTDAVKFSRQNMGKGTLYFLTFSMTTGSGIS